MMQVSEIMTREIVTIRGTATIAKAVQLMKEKRLRGLIVEPRNENDPFGIVTETDIIYKVAAFGHDPKQMRVYEIMVKPCVCVNPELGVEYAARLFAQTRIRRAPVIQGSTLVGIVSVGDILFKSDFAEKPKRLFIEDQLDIVREEARAICASKGTTAPECAAAWDVVEELQAEMSHQRSKKPEKTNFQKYCEANPDAEECRIYED
jgi:CBS domain-containing protein